MRKLINLISRIGFRAYRRVLYEFAIDNSKPMTVGECRESVRIQMSSAAYAAWSDMIFDPRFPSPLDSTFLQPNESGLVRDDSVSRIYLNCQYPEAVNALLRYLERLKRCADIYISVEPKLDQQVYEALLPLARKLFIQNNIFDHPKVHALPLGIRDGEETLPENIGFSQKYLLDCAKKRIPKESLLFMGFTLNTEERRVCDALFRGRDYVLDVNRGDFPGQLSIHCGRVPVKTFYEQLATTWFALSPAGCGVDCHRFYEAIFLRSTPIVRKTNTPFDRVFNFFPCLQVDDWSTITEEFLNREVNQARKNMEDFHNSHGDIFFDRDSLNTVLERL